MIFCHLYNQSCDLSGNGNVPLQAGRTSDICHHLLLKTSATPLMQADFLVDIEYGNIESNLEKAWIKTRQSISIQQNIEELARERSTHLLLKKLQGNADFCSLMDEILEDLLIWQNIEVCFLFT